MRAAWALSKLAIKEIFRKKDFYVALILTAVILVYASRFQFYDIAHIVRYLEEIGLTLIFFISVYLTVSLAGRQVPMEVENRTWQVLMAKPVRRWEFVFGKFLGSFAAGAAAFFIFFAVFSVIICGRADAFSPEMAAQTFYLFLLNLMLVAAMASGFSYYFTVGANVTISMVLYLLIDTYGPGLTGGIFYFLPHFEFFDLRQRFIHELPPVSAGLLGFLSVYAVLYSVIFLALGWIKFRKQAL